MATAGGSEEEVVAGHLVDLVVTGLEDEHGVRAEDAICALATIVGERCIDAAGEYDPRAHTFTPGARVFSDRVNQLIAGDVLSDELGALSPASIVGLLRDRLAGRSYERAHFPAMTAVLRSFAARAGKKEDWGTVPLSVPPEHQPRLIPLRVAFETRPAVDKLVAGLGPDKRRALRAAALALAQLLEMVCQAVDPKVALLLALETINGVSKTAPMTVAAMKGP
jgi:hypothetical protein